MNCSDVRPQLRVRTIALESTDGLIAAPAYLDARKTGVLGTVVNALPGHGGDVWLVSHDNSAEMAVYAYTELEPAQH